jgi:hypothetical protein
LFGVKYFSKHSLEDFLEWLRGGQNEFSFDNMGRGWLSEKSLSGKDFFPFFGLSFELVIGFHSQKEVISAFGLDQVLSSDVESLLDVSVSHWLVEDDTHRPWIHVENPGSLSLVILVRHALLLGWIDDDVDVVSGFEGGQLFGGVNGAASPELLRELVPGSLSEAHHLSKS